MVAVGFIMKPEIGRDYIGPLGRTYRVEAIEDPDGYPLVVIREVAQGAGTIRFPLWQAGKWLCLAEDPGR